MRRFFSVLKSNGVPFSFHLIRFQLRNFNGPDFNLEAKVLMDTFPAGSDFMVRIFISKLNGEQHGETVSIRPRDVVKGSLEKIGHEASLNLSISPRGVFRN